MTAREPALPDQLVAGHRRFQRSHFAPQRARYQQLAAEGQHPACVVVACSDSRTAPEVVFDARPGELFDIRNVAALVPVYEPDDRDHAASAALEFAVIALGVASIVVLGHAGCGGIAAALDDAEPLTATDFVGRWVAGLRDLAGELEPAEWADPVRRQQALELRSVEQSIDNLRTFPWIRSRERAGTLAIHGAWFDVGSGELYERVADGWVRVSTA
jgi:carbonic anhydrase